MSFNMPHQKHAPRRLVQLAIVECSGMSRVQNPANDDKANEGPASSG